MLCRFLTCLISRPPTSLTRVKVCFSSRPWDVFKTRFSDYPNISLQTFTERDIWDYSLGSIDVSEPSGQVLRELVPEIVEAAQGVFLWVRLVVQELSTALADGGSNFSESYNLGQLRALLGSYPKELNGYYAWIIHRIPMTQRWGTYVLLELVIRLVETTGRVPLLELVGALDCASSDTYASGRAVLFHQKSAQRGRSHRALADASRRVVNISGGLVEVLGDDTPQLMHQTVYDFVTGLGFKELVLGDLAKITTENGHSFHLKHYFLGADALHSLNTDPSSITEEFSQKAHISAARLVTPVAPSSHRGAAASNSSTASPQRPSPPSASLGGRLSDLLPSPRSCSTCATRPCRHPPPSPVAASVFCQTPCSHGVGPETIKLFWTR